MLLENILKLHLHSTKVRLKLLSGYESNLIKLNLHSTKVRLKHNDAIREYIETTFTFH